MRAQSKETRLATHTDQYGSVYIRNTLPYVLANANELMPVNSV